MTAPSETLAACRLAARAMGATLPDRSPELAPAGTTAHDHVMAAAQAWKLRARRVVLRDQWWRADAGPLVALDTRAGVVVALLPARAGRYMAVHPTTGARRLVTDALANDIDATAWSFMPPGFADASGAPDVRRVVLRGLRADIVRIGAASLAAALLALAIPLFTKFLVDDALPAGDRSLLVQVIIAGVAMAAGAAALELVRGVALLRVEARVQLNVDVALMDRLLRLPAEFFRRYSAGDLATRMVAIGGVRHQLASTAVMSLIDGVFALVSLAAVAHFSASLGAAAAALAAVVFAVAWLAGRRARHIAWDEAARDGQAASVALQLFAGIAKIRVAGAEDRAFARWWTVATEHRRLSTQLGKIENGVATFTSLLPAASMAALFAAARVGAAEASPGAFGASLAAFGLFLGAAVQMAGAYLQTVRVLPILARVQPVIGALPETRAADGDPGTLSGAVALDDVCFRYDEGSALVLDRVSLEVTPGEMIAIVGRSGSGKSTIIRLLLGLDTPESGAVRYDGRALTELDAQAIRRQLGVVLQHGRIMAGDVLGNILGQSVGLAVPDAWHAAEQAGLADDIRRMPMGIYTLLNEGGTTLSGGQRQRLLIARALARRPRLLLLDEATSALDNRTQKLVADNLAALNIARVVVAHRLTTVARADRIYLLENGRVAESGSYEALVRAGGAFAHLVRRQQVEPAAAAQ